MSRTMWSSVKSHPPVSDKTTRALKAPPHSTANLRAKIQDSRGFDSSRILTLRGEIPWPMGNFPESLSQQILAWIILVGILGVKPRGRFDFEDVTARWRVPTRRERRLLFRGSGDCSGHFRILFSYLRFQGLNFGRQIYSKSCSRPLGTTTNLRFVKTLD